MKNIITINVDLPVLDKDRLWNLATPVVWKGKTEGSVEGEETAGVDYRVLNGFQTEEHLPELWKLAERLKFIVQEQFGDDIRLMKSKASAVNVNILDEGHRYELHYDPNEVTAVVFWNDDYDGGELVVNGCKIKPVAGLCVIFEANVSAHEVMPVYRGRRFTIPIGYERPNARPLGNLEKQLYEGGNNE